ncbi:MAG TPA: hypothetical protein VKB34_17625 [Povalibacter sp.]|nr:hypothetical protein [Povalibacter sp.]
MTRVFILLATLVCAGATADDGRVIKLEQDVRNLERQVQELSRQLVQLQQRDARIGSLPPAAPGSPATQPTSPAWLDIANWKRVRNGMTEFEVISLLGPPTTLRGAADSGTRTLLYAMEIGSSGFLGGSVQLKDRHVVEIQLPALR